MIKSNSTRFLSSCFGQRTAGSNLFFPCGDFNNISSLQIHSYGGYYEA